MMRELNGSQIDTQKPTIEFYENFIVVDNYNKKIITV